MSKGFKIYKAIVPLMLAATFFIYGCGNSYSTSRSNNDSVKVDDTVIESQIFEEKKEGHSDDEYYIEILNTKENIPRDDMLAVKTAAYEGGDNYGAFIFTGSKDEEQETYEGRLWYVSDDYVDVVIEAENGYYDVDLYVEFDDTDKCFYGVNVYYTTDAVTHLFGVKDGKPYETPVSGIGQINGVGNNDIRIVVSAYDACYESEDDITLGHTWKPYFFHYDVTSDSFVEYVGRKLTRAEFEEKYKLGILQDIEAIGGTVTTIYERDNGIVNVNYYIKKMYDNGEYSLSYQQANYDVNENRYIEGMGLGDTDLEKSSYEGIYKAAILPKLLYNENAGVDEIYEAFRQREIPDADGEYCELVNTDDMTELELTAWNLFDVDEDGTDELIPVSFMSYTYCFYTIRDGLVRKINMDDCYWGSEGGFFNDKHQYVGTDCTHANRNQFIVSEYDSENMKMVNKIFFAKWWEDENNQDNAEYMKSTYDEYGKIVRIGEEDYETIDKEEYEELLSQYTVKNTEIKAIE
ncbi:MAG: hypothetical protein KBS96_08090 [Lachnospiraceae bacterium]|nr:hypothetical protein [Candidatus Colinaster scatohippi]